MQLTPRTRERSSWRRSAISLGGQSSTNSVQFFVVTEQEWLRSQRGSTEQVSLSGLSPHRGAADVSLSSDFAQAAAAPEASNHPAPGMQLLIAALRGIPAGNTLVCFSSFLLSCANGMCKQNPYKKALLLRNSQGPIWLPCRI